MRNKHTVRLSACAIAAILASTPLFAQESSTTLTGTIESGVFRGYDNVTRVAGMSLSYLNIASKENLGDGYSATVRLQPFFYPATGIAVDSPQAAGLKPFFHGESTVGLTTPVGSFRMGRALDAIYQNNWEFDPWYYYDMVASPAWQFWQYNYASDRTADNGTPDYGRLNNGLFYQSPNLGGVTVNYSGSFVKPSTPGGGSGNANALSLRYHSDKIALMLATAKNAAGDKDTYLGAKYTLGGLEIMGAYDQSMYNGETATSTAKVFTAGLSYAVGSMRYMAGYGHLNTGAAVNPNATMLSIGAQYFLSKRTNVYFSAGDKKFDGASHQKAYGIAIHHNF